MAATSDRRHRPGRPFVVSRDDFIGHTFGVPPVIANYRG
jgi:hypothetical protein